jgi:predicted metalloprotease with PDZ domain
MKLKTPLERLLNICTIITLTTLVSCSQGIRPDENQAIQYTVSMPDPSNHLFHIALVCKGLKGDTVYLKMPRWMPGYYQIMDYPDNVKNFKANSGQNKTLTFKQTDRNTWQVIQGNHSSFIAEYDVFSDRRFVANNYLDTTHGYIIPEATFMYPDGHLDAPVTVRIEPFGKWNKIATGLDLKESKTNEFTAPDFDILFDCPILIADLEELPSFKINGIDHRFIAYKPGTFNRELFMSDLEKAIKKATELIGDIPYKQYTFIGYGQGQGGIEHLNNTTIPFSGRRLEEKGAMSRTLKFIVHEYFHNYNVKRIRPFELGPFDYERENKTNLLWVSEGLTVYYEYMIVRRAGLMDDEELLADFAGNISAFENDPGCTFQSLTQASYETWSDGPFGNRPGVQDKSISYYDKGPVVGLMIDFAIRKATNNEKSLDDVMRYLYKQYYKTLKRGFTDAEFQSACELIAGASLSREFEYVYTTKPLDYSGYLAYAGLKISVEKDKVKDRKIYKILKQDHPDSLQVQIYKAWTGN